MSGLHVAIIMDGNGRWARSQGMPRWRGHIAGVESVRDVVRAAPQLGIDVLTLYAFSADNWKRPAMEVGRLFWLLRRYCVTERDELIANGVRVTAVGRRDRIPASALNTLEQLERDSAGGTKLHLRLAIDYSGRSAIADATRTLAQMVAEGRLAPDEMTEQRINDAVTQGVALPDLLVRTAGERRLSDFLLWEVAYTELFFSPVAWPAFRREHLAEALAEFRGRERRFGGLADTDTERAVAVG
jgi:undecaprenyl diphosphate synthase